MYTHVKKRFDLQVVAAGGSYSQTFELDKTITRINGLLFTSDRDDLLYYRGSQRVEINKEEIFPQEYESKLLMSGINVSPNDRYYNLGGIPPGNGQVKIDYIDTNYDAAPFTAYRVTVYLDCETAE
ncbi:hypothetical protein [Puia dinghuensis]|uniref:Uncharacterized protein n=1 Tax=Puia dinghuensis TaxID=1792502 RepID=A0A8J2UAN7_9BACT|nr:hypothetical protein [Puia dinghuensis]GGA89981.1 hypothetical protein GCM10011511_11530 [Puia dinghuensis]